MLSGVVVVTGGVVIVVGVVKGGEDNGDVDNWKK